MVNDHRYYENNYDIKYLYVQEKQIDPKKIAYSQSRKKPQSTSKSSKDPIKEDSAEDQYLATFVAANGLCLAYLISAYGVEERATSVFCGCF